MVPLIIYTLFHMFVYKINLIFDEVLEKENRNEIVDAQTISNKIKKTTNLSTVIVALSTLIWASIIFAVTLLN